MESSRKANEQTDKLCIITLKSYYKNLPNPTHPKKELIRRIAAECNVTEVTVRNWIMYGFRPDNPNHIEIISKITGIAKEDLWND